MLYVTCQVHCASELSKVVQDSSWNCSLDNRSKWPIDDVIDEASSSKHAIYTMNMLDMIFCPLSFWVQVGTGTGAMPMVFNVLSSYVSELFVNCYRQK